MRVVKSRRMRCVGHVARMGEERGVHMVLVGKPEGKRPLGRPRRRWEDNIKMDLREVGGVETGWSWLNDFYNGDEKCYCAVRTGSLNRAVCASSLNG